MREYRWGVVQTLWWTVHFLVLLNTAYCIKPNSVEHARGRDTYELNIFKNATNKPNVCLFCDCEWAWLRSPRVKS